MSTATTTAPLGDESSEVNRSLIGLRRPDHTTGLADWLTTVDHKKIAIMYAIFALAFLVIGGIEA